MQLNSSTSQEGRLSEDHLRKVLPSSLVDGLIVSIDPDPDAAIYAKIWTKGQKTFDSWVRVSLQNSKSTESQMEDEANAYRSPIFSVTPVEPQFCAEVGEYAFIVMKHNDPEVWTLRADSAEVQFGSPAGQAQDPELLESARKLLSGLA
ncbi:hypothetical protein L5G32_09000 [Gordonia sp. HY002]|uniref:hypothetical protein n=1 Tax=Gordonia zhenghanii TaxID=2911516 RepID=UPI001EF08CEA|nr:hypothetical protein [Gordonia zhenghanii]MCF8570401.1 hypothetical protein [Gordonia zhenghanii]MCF8604631.1 hypothetical protein [Gordonia zhenghanii]